MPTYDYKCGVCHCETSEFQSISEYCKNPRRPVCIHDGESHIMERKLSVNPAMSGLANAMAGDRHYDGMRATDGTDISTRTKHRQYMKANGLTTVDDFKNTWKDAAKERANFRSGEYQDRERKKLVTELVQQAVAQPD